MDCYKVVFSLSLSQDVFPSFPGDTDYRMFANDYGKIPGLDVIFILGGYFYHTSYDTVERLLYALQLLFLYIKVTWKFTGVSVMFTCSNTCANCQPDPAASKHVGTIFSV